jgi:histone acetyltransferase (RNA polymerase elongator complex component)
MIVPVFIPHLGCPHRCIFCQQEKITSQQGPAPAGREVRAIIEQALASPRFSPLAENEIAFFGGTFTSLPVRLIQELLEATAPYLDRGLFTGIRVSTRPDAIDPSICRLIAGYKVKTVELGAQSMNDDVLCLSGRGHTAADTVHAARLLKKLRFKLGIQIMPGLPGDSESVFSETISEVVAIHPDMVRIYPAVVIQGTALAAWYREGRYSPLSLQEAVERCQEACMKFEAEGISVIRLGLMNSPSLREPGQILAGPWHEAFGHLVKCMIYRNKIAPMLSAEKWKGCSVVIGAPPREISLLRGYKNEGVSWLEGLLGASVAKIVADKRLPPGNITVEGL